MESLDLEIFKVQVARPSPLLVSTPLGVVGVCLGDFSFPGIRRLNTSFLCWKTLFPIYVVKPSIRSWSCGVCGQLEWVNAGRSVMSSFLQPHGL